ncbi:MAG: carbon monoxide dehydrogenase G protein, partial [uncultured Pseudonocardia sp.]
MQLENKFTIDAPIEKAWVALNTPDMIAPCFPGATLTSYEGESFEGTVKVKLGPISLTYKGKGTYVDRDDANHRVTIEASGRDSRGNGTASATVTGTMVADGADRTAVTMVTDMTITGRPAQFGRGVVSDVADKIIGQFAGCVARKLAPEEEAVAAAPAPAATAATTTATGGTAAAAGSTNGAP